MSLNEKQSNLEKEMYGNISLYSQYFSPGAGSNVHKTHFYFLKLKKMFFFFIFLDHKTSIQNKKHIDVTHTNQNSLKIKTFLFPKKLTSKETT